MPSAGEKSHRIKNRIDWVGTNCRLLMQTAAFFGDTQPFAGKTIGTGIHLEPKTAALLLTLKAGGANVVATGNLSSTQPETVEHLRSNGVTVYAQATRDAEQHLDELDRILDHKPELLLDNGGDLFARYLDNPYPGLLGGTEETTSGRNRLVPLRGKLQVPVLVINDSPIKQFAENKHGVGQSVLESYLRFTNRITNGRRVSVFGYGSCGRGVAEYFRSNHAVVSVFDPDPVTRLEAHLDGFLTPGREEALSTADLVITITGVQGILTETDLALLKDGVVLANAGHFPREIDVPGISKSGLIAEVEVYEDDITTWTLTDGRRVHLLGQGHMMNLAGPRPLGNSIEVMDMGFMLQALCLAAVADGSVGPDQCVVPVPDDINARVAETYLALA